MREADYISNLLDKDYEAYETQVLLRSYRPEKTPQIPKPRQRKEDITEKREIRERALALKESMENAEISMSLLARKTELDRANLYAIFDTPSRYKKNEKVIEKAIIEIAKEKICTLNKLIEQIEG